MRIEQQRPAGIVFVFEHGAAHRRAFEDRLNELGLLKRLGEVLIHLM